MEQQETLPIPNRVAEDVAVHDVPASDDNHPNRRPGRTLTHLAVLTTVLVPITLLPYCVARRNINQLRRRLNEYAVTIARLQRDSKTTSLENALRDDRVRGLLSEMRRESRNINVEMSHGLESLRVETEDLKAAQATLNNVLRSQLQKALDETRRTRMAQFAVQKELGISLADVAAFMHEQSLSQGEESSGAERLRWLALSLQNLPQDTETDPSKSKPPQDPPASSQ